jgi:putative intracellular protease/amidase
VIPGGVGNPDTMRGDENAVGFVRGVLRAGQAGRRDLPRAVDARRGGVVRGRKVTSWPTLQTDIRNAGGHWVDEEVVVDQGSSRAASRTTCRPSPRRSSKSSARTARGASREIADRRPRRRDAKMT